MPTNELECSNVKQPEGGVLVVIVERSHGWGWRERERRRRKRVEYILAV